MYDALRNEYEQLKRGGGRADQALAPLQPRDRNAMMARPPQYNFGPSNSFDEPPQKTRPTQGMFDCSSNGVLSAGSGQGFDDELLRLLMQSARVACLQEADLWSRYLK
jgi:hypothetical protein